MDYVDFYYANLLGRTPADIDDIRATECTIAYLEDNGLNEPEIARALLQSGKAERLTPLMLPDSLWKSSLVKRGCFYYHNTLQIASRPPHYDRALKREVMDPYFLEMKIQYTIKDLVAYFYSKLHIDLELLDEKRDAARLEALLKKYGRLSFVESLDFVLALIDYAAYDRTRVMSVFDIEKNESAVYEQLKGKTAEAGFHGKNVIVWRQA